MLATANNSVTALQLWSSQTMTVNAINIQHCDFHNFCKKFAVIMWISYRDFLAAIIIFNLHALTTR